MRVYRPPSLHHALAVLGFTRFQLRYLSLCFFGYFAVVGELFVFVYLQEPLSQVWPYGATVYALLPFSTNLCTLCGECD